MEKIPTSACLCLFYATLITKCGQSSTKLGSFWKNFSKWWRNKWRPCVKSGAFLITVSKTDSSMSAVNSVQSLQGTKNLSWKCLREKHSWCCSGYLSEDLEHLLQAGNVFHDTNVVQLHFEKLKFPTVSRKAHQLLGCQDIVKYNSIVH